MCGIAGVVLAEDGPVPREIIESMTAALAHRGPDGQGSYFAKGVGLGHRRLSILDLTDASAQPMVRGEDALVFNGEIYNFASLRADLVARGVPFASKGDAEVLLRALQRWGVSALDSLSGMFAFAYYNGAEKTLLLCRDRFGKKPLYYASLDGTEAARGGLAFASEIGALLRHPQVFARRRLDEAALGQYLLHEYIPAPRSIFAWIRKLLPGEYLLYRKGSGLSRHSYYQPPVFLQDPKEDRPPLRDSDERRLVGEFVNLVEAATQKRLVADVPVGVFLSGGLDSSLIAACAARSHGRVRTFSIRFDEPSFDESAYAREVATHLGTEHTEECLTVKEMLEALPETLDLQDEPLADSSFLPTSLLSKLTRRHVKVALSGDGGDEILAGYPTFQVDQILSHAPALPALPAHLLRLLVNQVPAQTTYLSFGFKLRQLSQGLSETGARRHACFLAPFAGGDLRDVLHPALRASVLPSLFEAVDRAAPKDTDAFCAATAFYLRLYLGEGVLTKVDRATMRAGLEARAPLLDTAVVEFCLQLPRHLRIRGLTTKWLMRQALLPLVPQSIVKRPKKGFGAPVGAWLRGPLLPYLRQSLSQQALREGGLFQESVVTRMINEHQSGHRDHGKRLYALLVMERFRKRFL